MQELSHAIMGSAHMTIISMKKTSNKEDFIALNYNLHD